MKLKRLFSLNQQSFSRLGQRSRTSFPRISRNFFFPSPKNTEESVLSSDFLENPEKLKLLAVKYNLVKEGAEIQVGSWLLLVALMVLGMISLGGYTRLTKSGLSMVRWKPVFYRYPKDDETWNEEFDHYKKYPEYKDSAEEVTLKKFKFIFLVEYAHRTLGNAVGGVFIVPYLYFSARGFLLRKMQIRLLALLGLGGLQGLIGWWMVKSGLTKKPDYHISPRVSVYRLFVHLNMAILLFGVSFWNGITLIKKPAELTWTKSNFVKMKGLRTGAILLLHLIAMTIASGSIVGGLNAGQVFNTFPLMNGSFVPQGYWNVKKGLNNIFENMGHVQFNHRMLAYSTYTGSTFMFWRFIYNPVIPTQVRVALLVTYLLVNYQLSNGVLMLLKQVPVEAGVIHQTNAVLTLASFLLLANMIKRPNRQVYLKLAKLAKAKL